MSNGAEQFSHFASVLPTQDLEKSINFYCNQLNFELTFTWNDPVEYAVLKRGDVNIHLTKRQDNIEPSSQHTALYVFVHDVDDVYQEFISNGVKISNPIANLDYHMRDFDIEDPEGYILSFGKGIS